MPLFIIVMHSLVLGCVCNVRITDYGASKVFFFFLFVACAVAHRQYFKVFLFLFFE